MVVVQDLLWRLVNVVIRSTSIEEEWIRESLLCSQKYVFIGGARDLDEKANRRKDYLGHSFLNFVGR